IARLVPMLVLALGVVQAGEACQTVLAAREHYPRARYGALLDALSSERQAVLVIERGWKIPDDPHYAPELRFYVMVARERGRPVDQTGDVSRIASATPGMIVETCDPTVAPLLQAHAAEIVLERD